MPVLQQKLEKDTLDKQGLLRRGTGDGLNLGRVSLGDLKERRNGGREPTRRQTTEGDKGGGEEGSWTPGILEPEPEEPQVSGSRPDLGLSVAHPCGGVASAYMEPGLKSQQQGPLAICVPCGWNWDTHFHGQHRCDKKVSKEGM